MVNKMWRYCEKNSDVIWYCESQCEQNSSHIVRRLWGNCEWRWIPLMTELKSVSKWIWIYKWPLYDLFWPFFHHICAFFHDLTILTEIMSMTHKVCSKMKVTLKMAFVRPFLAILPPYACLSFSKLRFWQSSWGA